MERVPLPVLKQSFSTLQIMQAPLLSQCCGRGCSVYNSVQYYWWQIMINNNNIDKNGTLALTSDLICGPLCTIWCIEFQNHAWVHFAFKKGGVTIMCWQYIGEHIQNHCFLGVTLKTPLICQLTYSPAVVQQQNLGGKHPPLATTSTTTTTPPGPLFPFPNMIPPEGSPQTSFLINACGWWDHPVSAN